jgi:glycosyltransferase involved in cell wall biosynthesis
LVDRKNRSSISSRENRAIASSDRPRLLFFSRRYPPCLGGIETYSYELYTRLSPRIPVRLVALRRQSLLHLAWFLPYSLLIGLWSLLIGRADVVYFSDGVIGALAPFLRPFARGTRFAITIHGMEMTYRNPLARGLMVGGARACDRVVAVSQNTRAITAQCGVAEERLIVVYDGVESMVLPMEREAALRERFEAEHHLRFGRDRILLNCGRQVRRKGVADFLEKGFPLLESDIKLFIGGRGPELERIRRIAARPEFGGRVFVLGPLEDDLLAMLRASADLFLMPNIRIPTDIEGLGLAPLESMYVGTPVVAFAVDGLVEAIREGGYLVEADDYRAFTNQIHAYYALLPEAREAKEREARDYVRREYDWQGTAEQYLEIFQDRR